MVPGGSIDGAGTDAVHADGRQFEGQAARQCLDCVVDQRDIRLPGPWHARDRSGEESESAPGINFHMKRRVVSTPEFHLEVLTFGGGGDLLERTSQNSFG